MIRRMLLRSGLAIGFVLTAAVLVPVGATEAGTGICQDSCALRPCTSGDIMDYCSSFCDEATGGMCSDGCNLSSFTRFICTGNEQ